MTNLARMELTPQSVRTAAFKTVKKGYDPAEVDSFKSQVASAIETAQNQRTADTTVAEATAHAQSLTAAAQAEAARIIDAARADGRKANDDERVRAENEVQSLIARRDFLVSDVEHLEQHIGAQRERLRDAAIAIHDLVDRVPGGLGEIRRPLLSASDTTDNAALDETADMTAAEAVEEPHGDGEPDEVSPTGVGELPR